MIRKMILAVVVATNRPIPRKSQNPERVHSKPDRS
jgi:hypothetical protein